ncbi:hypothetical protein [Mycolicibacterium nivoides]|uniref:hypothetical protein n=1 Tax=Mycolicibacterium nivoides TaxID=2487344 RepID=UPI000F5BF53D|nr:hypothetical protein [Mycolicibacterium nivoides]
MADVTEVQADDPADGELDEITDDVQPDDDQGDTIVYKRADIEKLRNEARDNRHRAEAAEARVDELSRALFTARVEATGKLADPDDLPYDAELLTDDDKLNTAVDDLIAKRPHYGKRRVSGSVGQGVTGDRDEPFSLLGRLQRSV